jgi:thiol:disulfide interchange protein DsbA
MTIKFKTSLLSLLFLGMVTTACSAKETTATELTKSEATETTAEAVVEQVKPEESVDERYKALFETSKEAVRLSLESNPDNFVAGTHYDVFDSRQELLGDGEKIEIVEFFSYGCGHCFNAEPYMHAYAGQVADDVDFKRVPVSFNPFFEKLARGYYAAEALGASEASHIALFDALHIKRKQFNSVEDIADFYASYGVDKEQFVKAFNSFSINAQIERDRKLGQAYQITGVPTVIVNGAYKTGGVKAGNYSTWFQILDSLTNLEREK